MTALFDMKLRALRRDRAARSGGDLFLLQRAFDDCLERIELIEGLSGPVLLVGCPDPAWKDHLSEIAGPVDVADPGPMFARAAKGTVVIEDDWQPEAGRYGLVVAIGTLDTVDGLPLAFAILGAALHPGGMLIGAMSGGDTVPELRRAMAAADRVAGVAAPHVHPRIEASAVAPLIEQAGLIRPVIDVDRVGVGYRSLRTLVADLRAMAATNLLVARPRDPLGKAALRAAEEAFGSAQTDGRTIETFEVIHFAAWRPAR